MCRLRKLGTSRSSAAAPDDPESWLPVEIQSRLTRILALTIVGLLGLVIVGFAVRTSGVAGWGLLAVTVVAGGWFITRRRAPRPSKVANVWQGQSRGTATALLATGAVAAGAGMLYEATNPSNRYGLLLFATAAVCLGIGIHRNVRVVRTYFGRRWGRILNVLQFLLPLFAFGLDYAAELTSEQETKWLLRFLAVIPFVFLYLVMWIPLARTTPEAPAVDDTRIGRLG